MPPVFDTTISAVLKSASASIKNTLEVGTAEIDARILLQFCLQKPHSYLLTWPEKQLNLSQQNCFESVLKRRLKGEPIAYITGHREFWSMNLKVTADTLIPRPETELLVELAVASLSNDCCNVLDMGTGSGAIALAIASEKPNCQVLASDISEAALIVARENARSLSLSNVNFIQSDWGKSIPQQKFNLIVSNPPYIETNDSHLQQGDLRFEPSIALSAKGNGLADLQTVVDYAKQNLKSSGKLLMEHGFEQHRSVKKLLNQAGFKKVEGWRDIFGNYRVTGGEL